MKNIRYLSISEVRTLHDWIIRLTGGSPGIRDHKLLESALARPQAGFGEFEAYPDLFSKAAALIHSLVKNHPFIDANKRTAAVVTGVFLARNGYELVDPSDKLVGFCLDIATDKLSEEAIADWLKKYSQKV